MSLLSRLITPAATDGLAAALLAESGLAEAGLAEAGLAGTGGVDPAGPPAQPPPVPGRPRLALAPVGLGTQAARLPTLTPPATGRPGPEPGSLGGPNGLGGSSGLGGPNGLGGSSGLGGPNGLGTSSLRVRAGSSGGTRIPELYCPGPVRIDEALGQEVDDRLMAWAAEVGIYPGKLDDVRSLGVGRLMMLTHPDSDDADRLLAAAKCALAEWATDDHYVDDETLGADPAQLAARLVLANAVVDPAQLPPRYMADLERAVQNDPVLVAYRSSLGNLARYASPAQVRRLRQELAVMFLAYNQEGAWRTQGRTPGPWEYVIHRYENSFLPCMVLIDSVGGYEVGQAEFSDPRVRRVFTMAGLATVMVNDLYSVAKEQSGPDFNLPKLIAAEEGCGVQGGIDRTAEIHDELVRTVEAESIVLSLDASPPLQQFLAGIWAWMGGNYEWHRTSPRYNAGQDTAIPRGGART